MLIEELIIANELNGENNWDKISRMPNLSEYDLREYKDLLNWDKVPYYNVNIPNDLLDELITEKKMDLDDVMLWEKISIRHASDPKFIKKYSDKLNMKYVAKRNNFKASELVKMIKRPEIGEGATQCFQSDSYPFTVIEVNKIGNRIKVQSDIATPGDNFDYFINQNYIYKKNKNGTIYNLRLNKHCEWVIDGNAHIQFVLGYRKKYQNPSFLKY